MATLDHPRAYQSLLGPGTLHEESVAQFISA
jgi:hypothetical protein